MSSRQPSLGPPPPQWYGPPPGATGGAGTAVGVHLAAPGALALQWERSGRAGVRWDCSGSASVTSEGTGTALGAHLTYAICSNPRFSKHSLHEYCNFKVLAMLGLQRECFWPCAGRWHCSGNARGAPDRTGTATRKLLAAQIALGMQRERKVLFFL